MFKGQNTNVITKSRFSACMFFSKTIKLKIHRHMLSGVFLIYKDGTVPVIFSNCKTVTDAWNPSQRAKDKYIL